MKLRMKFRILSYVLFLFSSFFVPQRAFTENVIDLSSKDARSTASDNLVDNFREGVAMEKAKRLFYLSFEKTSQGRNTIGIEKPTAGKVEKYVKGIKGLAGVVGGQGLQFESKGNLNPDSGTICFWVRGIGLEGSRKYDFFNCEAKGGGILFGKPGWDGVLYFGVRSPEVKIYPGYYVITPEMEWQGEKDWHFVAVTWEKSGQTKVYLDGSLFRVIHKTGPLKELKVMRIGKGAGTAAIDEFMIFDRVINHRGVKRIYDNFVNVLKKKATSFRPAREIKAEEVEKDFSNTVWDNNKLGDDPQQVPYPHKPLELSDNGHAKVWNRDYDFNGVFPVSVRTDQGELLEEPIRMVVEGKDGTIHTVKGGLERIVSQNSAEACLTTKGQVGGIAVTCSYTIEYDGMIRCDVLLSPKKKQEIKRLYLEIPLKYSKGRLFWLSGSHVSQWNGPAGEFTDGCLENKFEPFAWVGDEAEGICFFSESDKNRRLVYRSKAIELIKDKNKNEATIRINIVDYPSILDPDVIKNDWKLTFGFQATPVRPKLPNWRMVKMNGRCQLEKTLNSQDIYIGGIPWFWAKPWMSYSLTMPEWKKEIAEMRDYRNRLIEDNQVSSANLCVYVNGQSYGYSWQDKGGKKEFIPEFQQYEKFWRKMPKHGNGWTVNDKFTKDRRDFTFNFCPSSESFRDYYAYQYHNVLKNHGINGIYMDETFTKFCNNPSHRCAFLDETGQRRGRYPIFAGREFRKRLYNIGRKLYGKKFLFVSHDSGIAKVPYLAFSDIAINGEAVGSSPEYSLDQTRPLEIVRSRIMYHQFGPVPVDLWKCKKTLKGSQRAVTIDLLHDINIWNLWVDANTVLDTWKFFRDAGITSESKFLPYWKLERADKPWIKTDNDLFKCSFYVNQDKTGGLLIGYYTGEKSAKISLGLQFELLGLDPQKNYSITSLFDSSANCVIQNEQSISLDVDREEPFVWVLKEVK